MKRIKGNVVCPKCKRSSVGKDTLPRTCPICGYRIRKVMKGLEAMTAERETIRELMTKYDEYREKWIQAHGTDEGFDDWFRIQTISQEV